jgi:hypothetical protein
MHKITNLQRSEVSGRTKLEVSATVADFETLAHMITCAAAFSGKINGTLIAKTRALYVVFTFKDYQGHMNFYAACLSFHN